MLVINLAKWNNQKFLGFTPYTMILSMCYTLFDSLYSGKKLQWMWTKWVWGKCLKVSTLKHITNRRWYSCFVFFFLLGQKETFSTFLKPITIWQALSSKQNIQPKSEQYLCRLLVLDWWLNQSWGRVMEYNLVLGRKVDRDLVVYSAGSLPHSH